MSGTTYDLTRDSVKMPAVNPSVGKLRVAIVHYWLVGMRGGEKVVEALCELFPQAEIFTHVYAPEAIPERIHRHKIHTTFINRLPQAKNATSPTCR